MAYRAYLDDVYNGVLLYTKTWPEYNHCYSNARRCGQKYVVAMSPGNVLVARFGLRDNGGLLVSMLKSASAVEGHNLSFYGDFMGNDRDNEVDNLVRGLSWPLYLFSLAGKRVKIDPLVVVTDPDSLELALLPAYAHFRARGLKSWRSTGLPKKLFENYVGAEIYDTPHLD